MVHRVLLRQPLLLRDLPLLALLRLLLQLLLLPLHRLPAKADSGLEVPLSSTRVLAGGRGKQRESSKAVSLLAPLLLSERQHLLPLQHPGKLLEAPTPMDSKRSRRLQVLTGPLDVARCMTRATLSHSVCIIVQVRETVVLPFKPIDVLSMCILLCQLCRLRLRLDGRGVGERLRSGV
jgi:hypothetical protein